MDTAIIILFFPDLNHSKVLVARDFGSFDIPIFNLNTALSLVRKLFPELKPI